MPELSLNILDIAENSFTADASTIIITIVESTETETITIEIDDNGKGMDSKTVKMVTDPLHSSKKGKDWGLGIPFFKQTADQCGGTFTITSKPEKGTRVTITIPLSHIDRPPLGNIKDTVISLIAGHPDKNTILIVRKDGKQYEFNTEVIRNEIKGVNLVSPGILQFIDQDLLEGLNKIDLAG